MTDDDPRTTQTNTLEALAKKTALREFYETRCKNCGKTRAQHVTGFCSNGLAFEALW